MKDNEHRITSLFPMSSRIVTITILINLPLIYMVIREFLDSNLVLEILSLVILISPALIIPLRLKVTEKSLKIRRPIGEMEIMLKDIQSCNLIEDGRSFIRDTVRTNGSGGLYGYIGYFEHDKYGKMRLFVTHLQQCFFIQMTDGRIFVVSSPKREEIVEFINSKN